MAPSSSPSPSPSHSKKLLITDPKQKPKAGSGRFAAPPNSASSSSTTNAPPPEKRTRDQPNLSDCHCCGRRINHTNPKDRLQPLDSVWRVVLLCRRCRKSLQTGQTCPYCFGETGNSGNLFKCSVCERKIHKDCVRDYGNCTPWCYLGVQMEGFRVCVDCWVPELLKNSVRACGKSENKGGLKDKGEIRDLVEKVVKGGKSEVEKKVKTVEKAKVVKNAVKLGNAPLDKNVKDRSKAENSNSNGSTEAVDDADLAIQLHRTMNSSPRICSSKSLVNSNGVDVSSIRKWKGLSYKRSRLGQDLFEGQKLTDVNVLNLGLLAYKRDRKRKVWALHDEDLNINLHSDDAGTSCSMNVSESSNCANTDDTGRTNVDRFGRMLVSYKRTRFKQKLCKANAPIGVSGECSLCDNHEVDLDSNNYQFDDANLKNCCLVKSDTDQTFPSGNSDAERDRYQLKYGKRVKGIKTDSTFLHDGTFLIENQACEPVSSNYEADYSVKCDEELILPNGICNRDRDRYCFKYTKRVKGSNCGSFFESKLHSGAFLDHIEASAPGSIRNCSAESRTPSDVSFDSYTANLRLPK